jgi:hypothetical protein
VINVRSAIVMLVEREFERGIGQVKMMGQVK